MSSRVRSTKESAEEAPSGGEPKLGLRERNKARKEFLIRQAAHALFTEKGFDRTTLRDVAEQADVGFGTVFSYAVDKAGLLAMVFVEALKELPPLFADVQTGDLLDDLVAGLSPLYTFWARTPNISRVMLQQMEFYAGNPHMDIIMARRGRTRCEIAGWLATQQHAGRVASTIRCDIAADTIFAVYTSALRHWAAADEWDERAGVARLRALLELPAIALSFGCEPALRRD